ncbi:MAG: NHL repeat-containing protein [bacterium]
MKRKITILFLILVLVLAFVQLLYKDKINLLEVVKNPLSKGKVKFVEGRKRVVRDGSPFEFIHNNRYGEWRADPNKQRQLIQQSKIGGKQAKGEFQFRNALDIEFDAQGNLYVLDKGNKSIEVFNPESKHLRTLAVGPNRERIMSEPTDLALDRRGNVYVSDRRKGILILKTDGSLLRSFRLAYQAEQLVVDSQGHIIVLTPSEEFRFHKLNSRGRELWVFGEQDEPSKALRQVFSQGILILDAEDNLYLSFTYPYRIEKYSSNGQKILAFDRELEILVTPPTIERSKDGTIKRVYRQEISYDLAIGPNGLIYNLMRTKGAKGGNIIDIFSPEGAYLQSFYLSANAISFALQHERLALLSPFKYQRIEVFEIMVLN